MTKRRLLGALAACLMLLTGCAANDSVLEAPALLEPVGVKTDSAVVERGDLYTMTIVEGAVIAEFEELSFAIDGRIGAVHCWPGMSVSAGDVLFEIDQTNLNNQLDELNRQIEYQRVSGAYSDELAELDIELLELKAEKLRAEIPNDVDAIALAELDIAEARLALEQAKELRALSIDALVSRYNALAEDVGRNAIVAPFDGHVFWEGTIEEGTYVQADKTVAYMANPNDLLFEAGQYISEAKLEGGRYYALIGDGRYDLEYAPLSRERMSSIILSGQTLTTRFRVVGEGSEDVRAGDYGVLCLETQRLENVLIVPNGALFSSASGRYVYVLDENGGRARREVEAGRSNGIDTVIEDGLEEGEVVYVKE